MKPTSYLRGSLLLKLLALLLLAALAVAGVGAAMVWTVAYNDNWEAYGNAAPPFQNTSFCRRLYYRDFSYDVLSGYTYESLREQGLTVYRDTPFTLLISDPEGSVVLDNRADGAEYMLEDSVTLARDRLSYLYLNEHTWDNETGERLYYDAADGKYHGFPQDFQPQTVTLQVQVYVTLPPQRGTQLYSNYTLYLLAMEVYPWCAAILIASVLLAALLLIYLLWAAGWRRGDREPVLRGPHKLPLELCLGASLLPMLLAGFPVDAYSRDPLLFSVFLGVFTAVVTLCLALDLITISARLQRHGFWRTTLVAWVLRLLGRFFRALPQTWKYVVAYGGFLFFNAILIIASIDYRYEGFFVCCLLLFYLGGLLLVVWFAQQQQELRRAALALSVGNVNYKVDTRRLWPGLRRQGEALNNIGLGIGRAVEARLQSERFKTDLITNVSHDLKTPLTNIVSYVDLLRRAEPGSPETEKYMEVLDRQAEKLKKLTEDLIDASKAASGAIPVTREALDAGELLRQSLGEWTERLQKAQVEPVLRLPEQPVMVLADGRQLWRVFDNLISNISKYSQPGTRAYVDLNPTPAGASIVFRNISREPLGVPVGQLLERFTRGDSSRHTEGSGLGLSIAASLTQLMGGRLELNAEGDLFRALLLLPLAQPGTETVKP